VFTVLIGALCFGYFLTITQTPQNVTEFLTGLGIGPYGVLALIILMYLVLGCLMDAMAMIILTVPIIFPVIMALGFDPIWFGVIIVMTVELGLIHPPVGMNVFVIKSVVKDVSFTTIFKGVLPFVATDLIRLVILIAFPDHCLVAAQREWADEQYQQRKSLTPSASSSATATPPASSGSPISSAGSTPPRATSSSNAACRAGKKPPTLSA
jgi:TRAP-type C4-dicarboxylate transport system permease large subunit